jgi:cation:H+ antiporter
MTADLAIVLLGVVLIYFGAEWFVKGAAGLAQILGVRPLLIGLTVVAFGTSLPELIVNLVAAVKGTPAIVLGNVVGSNIANLGLILGSAALTAPLVVDRSIRRREVPVLILTALLVPLSLWNGVIGRPDAALLLAGAAAFTVVTALRDVGPARENVRLIGDDAEAIGAPAVAGRRQLAVLMAVGLVLLLGGAHFMIGAASRIAAALGVSEFLIGLTMVAIGTSLPELAASLVASARGHSSLAVGNIIGSNVFNVLFVLGGTSMIHPIEAPLDSIRFDLAAMIGFTLLASALLVTRDRVGRGYGALLLSAYAAFVTVRCLMPSG